MRNKLFFLVGLATSALFLWLALRDADFDAIALALGTANLLLALPFLLALFLFYWLKSLRWATLLSPVHQSSGAALFPVVMIGYAGTAILPMQLGEILRTYVASRRLPAPFSQVLSSIALERLFDLLTIFAFLGIVLAFGSSIPAVMVTAGYLIAAGTLVAAAFAIGLAFRTQQSLALFERLSRWLPTQAQQFLLRQLESVAGGMGSLKDISLLNRIAINSMIQWSLMGACIWLSMAALDIFLPPTAVILVLVATIIGLSLPTSPGYIGSIQLAFVLPLASFGVSASEAVAASFFYHILAYVSVLLTGFGFAHRMGLTFGQLETEVKRESAADET